MGTVGTTRSATRPRALLALVVALALALSGLGGLGARPAAAQDDDAQQDVEQITQRDFDRLTRAGQRNEVVFGPEDGALELEEDAVAFQEAQVEVENFLVRAEFTNPYGAADGQWDYGFQFRSQSADAFLRLILLSDGAWGLTEGLEGVPARGLVESVNDGAGDTNVVDLYVEDEIGHFGLNGDYVATFELPVDGAGDISVGSGFLADSFQEDAETAYTGFIVWSLDEGPLGGDDEETPDPDDEETPDPDEELDDDDLTATAEAEDEGGLEDEEEDLTATAEAEEDQELDDDDLTATAEAEEEDQELDDDDLTATAEAEEDEEGTGDTGTTGDDPTYTSPSFGFTLSYDDPWELADEDTENGADILSLTSPGSSLELFAVETADSPEECLDGTIENVEDNPDSVDVAIAQDDQDRDLRDDSDELSWVVLFVTFEGEDGEEVELTAYYECRVIEEGESLLLVTHLALSDDYNDEIENRTAVLDTIALDGGSATTDDDDTPTEEPDEDEPTEEATEEATEEPEDEPTEEADDETPESDLPEGTVTYALEAIGDADLFAFGNVEPAGSDESRVVLIAASAGGNLVTIHEGSCDDPGEAVFDLGEIDEVGVLDGSIDIAVEDVTDGDYVMLISEDGTLDTGLACGTLTPLAE